MELPESIWEYRLQNGEILSDFVDKTKPTELSLADTISFVNVWQQRMDDAVVRDIEHLKLRAQQILQFLSDNPNNLWLLLWPKHKLSALFELESAAFLIIDSSVDESQPPTSERPPMAPQISGNHSQ